VTVTVTPAAPRTLGEFRLNVGGGRGAGGEGRECSVLHARALVSWLDEQRYLSEEGARQYGLLLWPAAIALALEISHRDAEFRGRRVHELGAGVGLPGIVAAMTGAHVVQTDRDEEAMALCRENAVRNGVTVEVRFADWSSWTPAAGDDWLIGSDVLYRTSLHAQLGSIFEAASRNGTRILIADPMRPASLQLLERMERDGWTVRMTRWTVGEGEHQRVVGVFDLLRGAVA
jgi:methyltransferase-like protein 23